MPPPQQQAPQFLSCLCGSGLGHLAANHPCRISKLPVRQWTSMRLRRKHRLISKLPVRQWTPHLVQTAILDRFLSCLCGSGRSCQSVLPLFLISKLPVRQWTPAGPCRTAGLWFSKLPVRQWTKSRESASGVEVSKLPVRQWTLDAATGEFSPLSKLPVRQWTIRVHNGTLVRLF